MKLLDLYGVSRNSNFGFAQKSLQSNITIVGTCNHIPRNCRNFPELASSWSVFLVFQKWEVPSPNSKGGVFQLDKASSDLGRGHGSSASLIKIIPQLSHEIRPQHVLTSLHIYTHHYFVFMGWVCSLIRFFCHRHIQPLLLQRHWGPWGFTVWNFEKLWYL